ncbi:MAG: glycosyltransferase, partial [Actinomycetota bacterium]|nr:glycosyltransferase [Actinomycetota bacterium]
MSAPLERRGETRVPAAIDRPAASIVIVTRNRSDALRAALRTATAQTGALEVLVLDDASSDGTVEMVSREFPTVRLLRSTASQGYIRQRNRGAHAARGPVIVSIDDDAEFTDPETVQRTLRGFDHPRVAAVAMPFVQERRSHEVLQRAPDEDGVWLTNAFIGTAHALRRDVFLALGGYRQDLHHLFEEPDFCLRLLQAGHVVRLGRASPVVHHESPQRNVARDLTHICRNHVLLIWFHIPMPDAVGRAAQVLGYV